jgi:hypothetical protein
MTEGGVETDLLDLLTMGAELAGISTMMEGWIPTAGGLP